MEKRRTMNIRTIKQREIRTRKGVDIGGIYTKKKSKTNKVVYEVIGFDKYNEVFLYSPQTKTKYQWSLKSFHNDFKRVG